MADAMILVAAAALGFGMTRWIAHLDERSPYDWFATIVEPVSGHELFSHHWQTRAQSLALLTTPTVATVTLALIPMRLIGPRPRFRRLARQPGLAASCAVGLATAFVMLPPLVAGMVMGIGWDGLWRMLGDGGRVLSATIYGGAAVLVSWTTQVVGGWRRAEASWIDRLGRGAGLYWIAVLFVECLCSFLKNVEEYNFLFSLFSAEAREIEKHFNSVPADTNGRAILRLAEFATPPIATATLILLSVRLIGARSKSRRSTRLPGSTALYASGLAMALIGFKLVLAMLAYVFLVGVDVGWEEISTIPEVLRDDLMAKAMRWGGFAVLISWATLLVGRRWRAEHSWTDRLGRAVGFCWILTALVVAFCDALIQAEDYLRLWSLHTPPAV